MFLTYAIINYRKKTTIKVFHIYNILLKKRKGVIMKRNIKKIVAGIIASLIITSNNTFAIFASNSEYRDDAANAYIEQIKEQDTLTKTKSILSYASKMDGTTENCVTAALNVYNLCEAAGIRCHVRTSANSELWCSEPR